MAAETIANFAYFNRNQIAFTALFLFGYSATCVRALNWDSDLLRMGVAGGLAHTTCECLFHVMDTVNIRTKAST